MICFACTAPSFRGRSLRVPRGFSMIEVVVAIVLLTVGILAVVKALAAMTGVVSAGAVTTRAVTLGSSRIERLLVGGCTGRPAAGDTVIGGMNLQWDRSGSAATVRLNYPLDGTQRFDTLTVAWWCTP